MTPRLSNERGFSLAELMVSLALTATVMSLALGAVRNMADGGDGAALTTDLNANLRATLNLMTRDLLSAGRGLPVGGVPIPSGDGALPLLRPSPLDNLQFPLGVTLPAVSPGDGIGPAIGDDPASVAVEGAQTDIISFLLADPTLTIESQPLTAIAADGRTITVDAATPIDQGPNAVRAGDLIMLSNALGSAMMMVTGRNGQIVEFAANDPMQLNQLDAPSGTILNLQSGPGVYPPTTATRVQMISYYLDDSDRTRPRMMRRVNMFPPRPIGIVIENLQITYDIVNGVDNPPNQPAPPPNQIRKANVFVAGRSHREWQRTRTFLRTSVASQVSLRSLAFVDRYR